MPPSCVPQVVVVAFHRKGLSELREYSCKNSQLCAMVQLSLHVNAHSVGTWHRSRHHFVPVPMLMGLIRIAVPVPPARSRIKLSAARWICAI